MTKLAKYDVYNFIILCNLLIFFFNISFICPSCGYLNHLKYTFNGLFSCYATINILIIYSSVIILFNYSLTLFRSTKYYFPYFD